MTTHYAQAPTDSPDITPEDTMIGCTLAIMTADGQTVTDCPVCGGSHDATPDQQDSREEHGRG